MRSKLWNGGGDEVAVHSSVVTRHGFGPAGATRFENTVLKKFTTKRNWPANRAKAK